MKIYQLIALGLAAIPAISSGQGIQKAKAAKWFPVYDFNTKDFQKPAIQFAPFARWWWPGNYVDSVELKREINLFADNSFGGMEIQPMGLFIPGPPEVQAKVKTWDTPEYYANVIAVMQEARNRGLTIDMTDGSGWPPGGPFLNDADGFKTLAFQVAKPAVQLVNRCDTGQRGFLIILYFLLGF